MCATGRSETSWKMRWIGAESENGATLVRTTQASGRKPLFKAITPSRTCGSGTNISGTGSLLSPASRASATTPTISRGGSAKTGPMVGPMVIRWPRGFAFGQN